MAAYSQANRPLAVTTPLGKDVLLLQAIRGREAISQLFEFQLELLAEKNASVTFDRVIGRNVTVEMPLPDKGKRYFNGIVRRFEQGGRDREFAHFRAELVPEFWLWTKKVQSRIFQHLSVPDILKQVLGELKVNFQTKVAYQPRDYCVQYRESDFAFASRLMEEEGIYYYFDHTSDSHTLVVCDDPTQHPDVADPSSLIYEEVEGGTRKEQRVSAWIKSQEVCSGKYTLWDHHFELTGQNLESQRSILSSVTAGKIEHKLTAGSGDRLEIYDYPGGYAQRFDGVDKSGGPQPAELIKVFDDGKRTAKICMEQESAGAVRISGVSSCEQLAAGHRFTLTRHVDADGKYLLTGVEHAARLGDAYRSGAEPTYEYENRFTAIPVALPYRPPRATPKPIISGTQTATVVGLPGQEIFLDKYGRVKVQFPWDRQGKRDANSSCWIRVSQVWAGNTWGAFFWPRVGHEVVVAFEEGDPDRPLIVGSLYNNSNMPPYELPKAGVMAGIKSCTLNGKPARDFNLMTFHDEMGEECLVLHSQKYVAIDNEHTRHEYVPASHVQVIGNMGLPSGSGGGGGLLTDMVVAPINGQHVESGNYQYFFGDNVQIVSRGALPSNQLQWVYGTNIQAVYDPVSFLGDLVPTFPIEIFGVNGSLQPTLGNNLQYFYGVASQVTRGPQVNYATTPLVYTGGSALETGVSAAVLAISQLASLTGLALACLASLKQAPSSGTDIYKSTRDDLLSAENWVIGLAWGLVVVLETAAARVSPGTSLSVQGLNLVQQALEDPLHASHHINLAANQVAQSTSLLSDALMPASALLSKEKAAAPPPVNVDTFTVDKAFIAPNLGLIAIGSKPGAPSNVVIDAQGNDNNGQVFINAASGITLSCGPAKLIMHNDGTIALTSTGKTGKMSLQFNGEAAWLSNGTNMIRLGMEGIQLECGTSIAAFGPSGWDTSSTTMLNLGLLPLVPVVPEWFEEDMDLLLNHNQKALDFNPFAH